MNKYDYQQTASRLLEETNSNLLVVAPTGAGKTRVGYQALEKYGKGIYVAPTRTLCYEKAEELKKLFPQKKVVLGNKDYSLGRRTFKGSDFRVITPWKLNQFLQSDWFAGQSPVIIFDEIHGLSSDLEIIITKLKEMHPSVRLIGLSATVAEEDEAKFASWLNALVVKSEERPVPIVERVVFFDQDLDDNGNEVVKVKVYENGNLSHEVALEVEMGKNFHLEAINYMIRSMYEDSAPCLWFSPYRGRAAEIAGLLTTQSSTEDSGLRETAENLSPNASEFSSDLVNMLPHAVGFHHGGLSQQERELVFELAQSGKLNNIATCFTLAQGVNLPARHIVFDTIYDYADDGNGNDKRLLDISLFRQLEGRCGRPQYDSIGYCWIPVFSEVELVEVQEVLLKYKASKLESRIFNSYFLTATLPQLVQFGFDTPEQIAGFIKATFWGKAMQDTFPLMDQLSGVISRLIDLHAVKVEEGKLCLTQSGKQSARLGLHPAEYSVIHGLVSKQSVDYDEWVENLATVCADYVIGANKSEELETALTELKTFGLAVWTSKCRHYTRDLADYVSRLLDIVRSYFGLNRRMDDYEEKWVKAVAEKFVFGQLYIAEQLAPLLRRDQLKRLIRNVGNALTGQIYDAQTQRAVAKILFSEARTAPNGTATKVAEIIGADPDEFRVMVEEEISRKQRASEKEKEVLA